MSKHVTTGVNLYRDFVSYTRDDVNANDFKSKQSEIFKSPIPNKEPDSPRLRISHVTNVTVNERIIPPSQNFLNS